MSNRIIGCFCCLLVLGGRLASAQVGELKTVAESSDFQSTAPYADVLNFCEELAKASEYVQLLSMGRTYEKRDIPLLVIADPPIKSAEEAKKDPRPVVFAMGNIHAGEVCGKEALLMLARDLIAKKSPVYKELILVFAPIYNADGNERFSTTNRPGQIGPSNGMGQRPNAMGLDLNRDHMKLESLEARSLARFMADWEPIIAMDLHTTDGSFHRYRLTYDSPRNPATETALLEFGRDKFLPTISKELKSRDPEDLTFYYGNFSPNHDQWRSYPAAPRYSTHYFGLRNSLGILSEAYAFISYRDRVLMTYRFVDEILTQAAKRKSAIVELTAAASKSKPATLPIRFRPNAFDRTFKVPGYKEEVAGRGRLRTEDDEEAEYELEYFGIAKSTLDVKVPASYVVPATYTKVIENLRNHGVQIETLDAPRAARVTAYKITNFRKAKRAFQGHTMISEVEVETTGKQTELTAGSVVVSTDQPLVRLIVNLLEPQAADGLTTWNFLDDALSSGEYPILRIER